MLLLCSFNSLGSSSRRLDYLLQCNMGSLRFNEKICFNTACYYPRFRILGRGPFLSDKWVHYNTVAQKESRKEFAIKRLFRIYPPLIVSIFLILVVFSFYSQITGVQTYIQNINPNSLDILLNISLLNYFVSPYPGTQINGIAWVLAIECVFYVACFLILPILKNKPKLSLSLLIGFVAVTLGLYTRCGPYFDPFTINVAFIPYLIMGQILYFRWKSRISTKWFFVFTAVTYFLTVQGLLMTKPSYGNTYSITFAYAYLIFLIALLLNERIKVGRVLGFYSKISYSVLVNNGIGIILIAIPFALFEYSISLVIGLLLLTALSYLSWKFVEEPFRKFSKEIVAKLSKSERKVTSNGFKTENV